MTGRTVVSREQTAWTPLLDRVEARLHRLQALAADPSGEPWSDPGPDPTLEDIPMMAPNGLERARLSIILPAHSAARAQRQEALAGAHPAA